jgi:hypothetical protein
VVRQIAGAIDLLPTITSLAGVKRVGDQPLDGRDLSPLLFRRNVDWADRMIFSAWAGRTSVRTQQYRLDDQGRLFDMLADPGQTMPIQRERPDVVARLSKAVKTWRAEMNCDTARSDNKSVDPRPLPVGYREFPITMLPARDGEPRGNIRRSSGAPNCSYFVNWKSVEDAIVWNIEVQTTGRYEVVIDRTCPEDSVGALVELGFQTNRLEGRVESSWDPPLYTNQDTLPRPHGESPMKEFRPFKLGEIELSKGTGLLTLKALQIPGKSVMDVRRLTLTLLNDKQP